MKKNNLVFRFHLMLSLVLILGAILDFLYAQQPFSASVYPSGIKQSSYRADSIIYINDGFYHIGRDGGTEYPYSIWRSYGTITFLSLPPDAKIDNATLSISFSAYKPSYSLKIVRLSSDPGSNFPETNWASIGSGTEWVSAVTTANVQTPSIPDLVAKLQALIDNSTPIYMGFKCNFN